MTSLFIDWHKYLKCLARMSCGTADMQQFPSIKWRKRSDANNFDQIFRLPHLVCALAKCFFFRNSCFFWAINILTHYFCVGTKNRVHFRHIVAIFIGPNREMHFSNFNAINYTVLSLKITKHDRMRTWNMLIMAISKEWLRHRTFIILFCFTWMQSIWHFIRRYS